MKFGLVHSLLCLGVASQVSVALAQPAGTFTPTGNMTMPRSQHSATLLRNGQVLIAGGHAGNEALISAELYDPATGTFIATGNMITGRAGHTATLLADGRVLILGGSDVTTAEIYDPTIGTFTATGKMSTLRYLPATVLLRDGRVLVVGGFNWNGQTDRIVSADLYEPSTGIFTPTGATHNGWPGPTATMLADGSVLIAQVGPEGEVYVPATGTFTPKGVMRVQDLFDPTASLLMDGTVLLTGGGNSDPGLIVASAERYEPALGAFSPVSEMILTRAWHTSTLLPDGTVLIVGGASYLGYNRVPLGWQSYLTSVELYLPASQSFSEIGFMTEGRFAHTATLLIDGRVLIAGGVGAPGYSSLATAEIYNPAVLTPAPALLSVSGDGNGQGAILHAGTHGSLRLKTRLWLENLWKSSREASATGVWFRHR